MTAQDRSRFARLLTVLAEVYGENLSEFRMEAYYQVLSEFPIDSLERAGTQAIKSMKFFPKPAELIELLAPNPARRALLAWHAALEARNPSVSVRFEDLTIHAVILRMGGWPEFCEIEQDQLPFRQREFERLYMALSMQPALEAPDHLVGTHERIHPGEPGIVVLPGFAREGETLVKHVNRLETPLMVKCHYVEGPRTLTDTASKSSQSKHGADEPNE